MSKLSADEVKKLAELAKLKLSENEIKRLQNELSDVISYFAELTKVPTDNTLPTSQTTGLEDVLRDDEVNTDRILSNEEALSGTDKIHNGYIVVPQVINKDA